MLLIFHQIQSQSEPDACSFWANGLFSFAPILGHFGGIGLIHSNPKRRVLECFQPSQTALADISDHDLFLHHPLEKKKKVENTIILQLQARYCNPPPKKKTKLHPVPYIYAMYTLAPPKIQAQRAKFADKNCV